jgi:stage II sporulation protein D
MVYISAKDGFVIYGLDSGRDKLFTRWNSNSLKFHTTARGMGFLKQKNLHRVEVDSFKDQPIYVNGKGYRGKIRIVEDKFGKLTVINDIDIESYLFGVIKSEMLINSPLEALKAQAVVARTYAIKNMNKFTKELGFGLTDDIRSQVYNGIEDEHPIARKVVKETRGKILTFGGDPISAFYHSACGGYTLDSKDWHGKIIPYLKSKKCGYCADYVNYKWELDLSYTEIKNKLREKGMVISEIHKILFSSDSVGRVLKVEIYHDGGVKTISSASFRELIGASTLRSTFFRNLTPQLPAQKSAPGLGQDELAIRKILLNFMGQNVAEDQQVLHLEGTGFGHGVGLCQWGAKGFARRGEDYRQILQYYYTGAKVTDLY